MNNFLKNSYGILFDGNCPTLVAGLIQVVSTKDRETPFAPYSGFICGDSPYAKGHIMALELSGPDIPENIVPQFGQWQGVGDWRKMEVLAAQNYNAHFFTVCLDYEFTGLDRNTFADPWEKGTGEIEAWKLKVIPSRFRVRVLDFNSTHSLVTELKSLLGKTTFTASEWSNWRTQLELLNSKASPVLDLANFSQHEMPEIDKEYWLGQHSFVELATMADNLKEFTETATLPKDDFKFFSNDQQMVASSAKFLRLRLANRKSKRNRRIWSDDFLRRTINPHFALKARFGKVPQKTLKALMTNKSKYKTLAKNLGLDVAK